MRVLGARVLVREDKNESATKSGLIIPGKSKEPTFRGEVVSVGDGAVLDNGERIPMQVSVGDKVVYTSFSGSPIEINGEIFVVLNERDILAVI